MRFCYLVLLSALLLSCAQQDWSTTVADPVKTGPKGSEDKTDTTNQPLAAPDPDTSQAPEAKGRPIREVLWEAHTLMPRRAESGYQARPANPTCVAPPRPRVGGDLAAELTPVFNHLRFAFPISMEQTPWDDQQWVVIERQGKIWLITGEDTARVETEETEASDLTPGPERKLWLDLTPVTFSRSLDSGLLGMAFHPRFGEGPAYRWVFFSYMTGSSRRGLYSVISKWKVNDKGEIKAKDEVVVLKTLQPGREHNGGHIAFGLDGYLYIGFGDGRLGLGGGDPSQRRDHLMGKVLRIDVDTPGAAGGYAIPPDNPFVADPDTRPEIYAIGLRNPWRFSFDRAAGTLWLGDVGAANFEEIDIIKPGGNYGWNLREGSKCNWSYRCKAPYFIDPVFEYTHEEGRAITGGYVYHGAAFPGLVGRYIFGDFGSGNIWALFEKEATGGFESRLIVDSNANPSSFAQARNGELYVVHHASETGRIFRLDPLPSAADTAQAAPFPQKLSQTGCVDLADPKRPSAGMIPYEINAPFWSDGAKKARWFAIPDGTQIAVGDDGDWDLPIGSVTLKHFWVFDRLIETRLLVRHTDGDWGGYTYLWNDSQTDADLLDVALTKTYTDPSTGKTQDWYYPSRAQCSMCHTQAAGRTLGLESAQLKRVAGYPSGVHADQLQTLTQVGILPSTAPDVPPLASPRDPSKPLDQRARAYLHTNCASCHRPDGADRAKMDLRITTDLGRMNICDQEPELDPLEIKNARLLAPGEPDRSVMFHRASRRDMASMPPIGSLAVDEEGAALLNAWISTLTTCPTPPTKKTSKRPKKKDKTK